MNNDSVKLSYLVTGFYKILAIFMVIVSHWYRYYDTTSSLSLLRSMGFFGAALFAFLSGYGVCMSYKKKWIGGGYWLWNKVKRVYLPFLVVNSISAVFVYKDTGVSFWIQVFTGKDDFVMWYVPFILMFYFFFRISIKYFEDKKILFLSSLSLCWIIIGFISGLGSQWYTATGALLWGVVLAEDNNKNMLLRGYKTLIITLLWILASVISVKLPDGLLKDIIVMISGIMFVNLLYVIGVNLEKKLAAWKICMITILSEAAFWVYLIHMKILKYFQYSGSTSIFGVGEFIILSFAISIMMCNVYKIIIQKFCKWLKDRNFLKC